MQLRVDRASCLVDVVEAEEGIATAVGFHGQGDPVDAVQMQIALGLCPACIKCGLQIVRRSAGNVGLDYDAVADEHDLICEVGKIKELAYGERTYVLAVYVNRNRGNLKNAIVENQEAGTIAIEVGEVQGNELGFL